MTKRFVFESVFLACFLLLAFFLPPEAKHIYMGDGQGYCVIARNIAFNGAYSLDERAPFSPTVFREPAYPFFLSLFFRAGVGNFWAMLLGQMILLYLTAWFSGVLASALINRTCGLVVRLLVLFYPTLLDYCRMAYSELLAAFLMLAFVYSAFRMFKNQRLSQAVLSGISLGALILCKVMMLYFAPVLVFLSAIVMRKKRPVILSVIAVATAYILIFPWMLRVHGISGKWQVTTGREAAAVFVRGYKQDYSWRDIRQDLVFNFSENLGRKLFPQAFEGLTRKTYTYRGQEAMGALSDELRAQGLSEKEIDERLISLSMEKIKKSPGKYLALSLLELEKMLAFNYLPSANCAIGDDLEIKDGGSRRVLRYLFRLLGYVMFFAALSGLWVNRDRAKEFFLLGAVLVYVNVFNSLLFAEGRFNVPLIPLIVLLDIALLARLLKRGRCPARVI